MAVSLWQITQIISGVSFITDCVAYASTNKTKIVWIDTTPPFFLLFFLPGLDASHVYVRAWALSCSHSLISTQTLSPFLTGRMFLFAEHTSDSSMNYDSFLNLTFSSPNIVRTVRRTLLRSQLAYNEMQASARTCGWQHDRKCRLSQYTLIIPHRVIQLTTISFLGPRDKAVPATSQQIKEIPPKRVTE